MTALAVEFLDSRGEIIDARPYSPDFLRDVLEVFESGGLPEVYSFRIIRDAA